MRNKLFICMLLLFVMFSSDAATKKTFFNALGRGVVQQASKLKFESSLVGLSKIQKKRLLGYYDELARVLSAEKAIEDPSLQKLKRIIETNKDKPDTYFKNYEPYESAIRDIERALDLYKNTQEVAQKEAQRAQVLAQKALEEAAARTKIISESEQELKKLGEQLQVEEAGIRASQKLHQQRVDAQQSAKIKVIAPEETAQLSHYHVYRTKKEIGPEHVANVSSKYKEVQSGSPQAPIAPIPSGSSSLIQTKELGGGALKVSMQQALGKTGATFVPAVKAAGKGLSKTASKAGSLVKRAATSKIAERLYAPLILLGIGTTIAVIEELDRIEQEEKEKLAALEKEQLVKEQKILRDRLQQAEHKKEILTVDQRQTEQLIKELQEKEKVMLQKEILWQELSLDVLANLKELSFEFKKTKSKDIEKQFAVLSTKLRIMQLLDQATAQMQTKPVVHKEIQQELDTYKNQIEELKYAFYKEMRDKQKSGNGEDAQNRFAQAKVFATAAFKKYGVISSKNIEDFLNKIVAEYRELYDFSGSILS